MSGAEDSHVEPAETFIGEIGDIDGVNETTARVNTVLNELRKRGEERVRVAIVEVEER